MTLFLDADFDGEAGKSLTIADVSVRTSEMLQHIAGVSSSVCVTPGKEIELGFLSPVHQR